MPGLSSRHLLKWGSLATALFLASMAAEYVLEYLRDPRMLADADHILRYISLYAYYDPRPLWNFAVVCYAVGSYMVGMGLRTRTRGVAQFGATLLAATGALAPILLIFPTDRHINAVAPTTLSGFVHDTTAVSIVSLQSLALVFLTAEGFLARPFSRAWAVGNGALAWMWMATEVVDAWWLIPYVQRILVLSLSTGIVLCGVRAVLSARQREAAPLGVQESTV